MAGLLNLMPRYLPRYGMAPDWARAVRPLVLVFTLVGVPGHLDLRRRRGRPGRRVRHRRAGPDHSRRDRRDHRRAARPASAAGPSAFAVIAAVFLYTTVANVIERPDGVKIGACFIAAIIVRLAALPAGPRLRAARRPSVELDDMAERFIRDCARRKIRFIANEPDQRDRAEYRDKIEQIRRDNDLPVDRGRHLRRGDRHRPLRVRGRPAVRGEVLHGRYRVLTPGGSSVPNALAALLLHVRDAHRRDPAHLLRVDRGQPVRQLPALLPLRPGRGRPRHPRGPAPGRARP